MAFTYTVTKRQVVGDKVRAYGTYTSAGGSTGGNINAQMDLCYWMKLEHDGGTVLTTQSVVNETFPCEGHAVTIVTTANESGRWIADGEGMG